jgi:hypothetical protein
MNKPKILNINTEHIPDGAVYIGRPSKWGNPFQVGRDGAIEEIIVKYLAYMEAHPELIEAAKRELKGKNLVCHCAPALCHGHWLLKIANADKNRN